MNGNARDDKIGFVGMGVMGGGMAANLLKNGFAVVGYDISPARNDHMAGLGAEIEAGKHSLASLEKAMLEKGDSTANQSGRQELFENIVNHYIF